jgi:hypothetical protein
MAKVAGSIWVEGNDIHYVDQFAREWMMVGILVGAVTAKPGSLWFSTTDYIFHYINEAGDGHYRIASQPLNVPNANAVAGSLWIGEDNCIHWINFFRAGAPNWHSHSHIDVPPVSSHVDTHTDTHGDTPHSDSAHVDGAHTDIPGGSTHIDYHYDVPHNDFNDSYHGDFGDVIYDHGDFNDAVYYYHPSFQHLDGAYYHYHGDLLVSSGILIILLSLSRVVKGLPRLSTTILLCIMTLPMLIVLMLMLITTHLIRIRRPE